ncbi:MAG: haloacid dehalogenase type II [Acidobacteria bacterium]|nr:haloacid dehalogenase type II [Acidobacteriota bacterium]
MIPELVTFDVYTALFDIEGSLTPWVREAVGGADALDFVRRWRRKQMEWLLISNALARPRPSFAWVTRRALDDTLARADRSIADPARASLVAAWNALEPWPEAAAALQRVKERGCPIGLLSNGDEAMQRALLIRLPDVVDHVFSSEHAGRYKPHPAVYALPTERLRLRASAILHVAGSPADVIGAKAAGLQCAWSNRRGEPIPDPQHPPDWQTADLSTVPDVIG